MLNTSFHSRPVFPSFLEDTTIMNEKIALAAFCIVFVQYRCDLNTCLFGTICEFQVSPILKWCEPICFRVSSKLDTTVKKKEWKSSWKREQGERNLNSMVKKCLVEDKRLYVYGLRKLHTQNFHTIRENFQNFIWVPTLWHIM